MIQNVFHVLPDIKIVELNRFARTESIWSTLAIRLIEGLVLRDGQVVRALQVVTSGQVTTPFQVVTDRQVTSNGQVLRAVLVR